MARAARVSNASVPKARRLRRIIARPSAWLVGLAQAALVVSLLFSGSSTALVLAANASASLDQCANDPSPSPNTDGCSASAADWVNGNLNEAKSIYFEGDSVPYRLTLDNLTLASHTVQISWDTTKSDKH